MYMAMDSKLRSFTVSSIDKYNKFAEIQRNRNKKTGERLNELIEKEVKEADPLYVDKSAARTPKMQDLVIPNPFVLGMMEGLPAWEEYMRTLTQKEHSDLYNLVSSLKLITHDFTDHVDRVL